MNSWRAMDDTTNYMLFFNYTLLAVFYNVFNVTRKVVLEIMLD